MLRALNDNTRVMADLAARMEKPARAEVVISGEKGLDRQLNVYNQLIKNASR